MRPRPAVLLLLLAVVLGPVAAATLARRPAADFALPVPYGGQRRSCDRCFLEVVVTGHRYVDARNQADRVSKIRK